MIGSINYYKCFMKNYRIWLSIISFYKRYLKRNHHYFKIKVKILYLEKIIKNIFKNISLHSIILIFKKSSVIFMSYIYKNLQYYFGGNYYEIKGTKDISMAYDCHD